MKPELKANIIDAILTRTFALFFNDQFRGLVDRFIRRNYAKGMEAQEMKLDVNFNAVPDEERVRIMCDHAFDEVAGITNDLRDELRATLREGLMNNEPPSEIKKRIELVLNPTEKLQHEFPDGRKVRWSDRLTMIARTEGARASNQGKIDAFKQSGLIGKKWISVHPDERLCPVCSKAGRLFSADSAIPIDTPFDIPTPKGIYSLQKPPIHPNCRCAIMFEVDA